jgi:hydroxymethylpyrimidine pyrophosphatase-like HAD family hydrolase
MSRPTFELLACDYDGTLAQGGLVDAPTLAAIGRLRAASVRTVLVTGRRVSSLLATFPEIALFELVVAENGAVLFEPGRDRTTGLAMPPPPELLACLARNQVPFVRGHSIIESIEPHEQTILEGIRELGIEWHIVFNLGAVMVLPPGVTKATGLARALQILDVPPDAVVGIGDAENDHALLGYCGLSVAVANALPAVRAAADLITKGDHGRGVAEVVDLWLGGHLKTRRPKAADSPSS